MDKKNISAAVIRRLPRYYRYLGDLELRGVDKISSQGLARMMNVTASQIRQDLNCFGDFGQQGYGYRVGYLLSEIRDILGVNDGFTAVIVGAGNLGSAIVRSHMFERRGVRSVAMFDASESLIGNSIAGVPILDSATLGAFCRENKVDIGILTLPKSAADDAISTLEAAGVHGIWNFTGKELKASEETTVIENVHLGDSLMTLCYRLRSEGEDE